MSINQQGSLFNIAQVPFSTFGSWLSISIPRGEEELFFRNHHGSANNLFPLRTLVDGQVFTPVIEAQPWVLVLTSGQGRVEICFERPGTVRMRGQGLGFQLGGMNLAYSEGANRVVFNCPFTRRYQIEALHGSVELRQTDSEKKRWARQAFISPGEDGRWELAIDEFGSTWKRPERAPFDRCLDSARKAFTAFLETMPAVRPGDRTTQQLATYVNWSCAVEPCGLVKRPSLLMSKNWMNNVWSWDHCFNAMALATGQPELALDQMLTMVDHQDEFGCYPDSINDVNISFNFSKPPVHGLAFKELLARMPCRPAEETMETMYASLSRQADWWMTNRRLEGSALPYYLHGNDSGWDNSTMFSSGVPLFGPDLAALLVVQMEVLADMAGGMGDNAQADQWKTRADDLLKALIDELWCGDHFVARLGDGSAVECKSLIPWLPIILGRRLPEDIRLALKAGIEGHLTEWGLATEKVDSPRYQENGYWQGPIWAPSTFLAVMGLDRAGLVELADTVSERFCRMCAKSGFPENFNALTGEPLRDPAYTWTASVFLLLAERMNQRTA